MANLLIIDDDPGICHVLKRTAQRMNHEVRSCASLQAGLRALEEIPVDVVLLDVYLPDGNGIEALEKFSGHASRPEVVIITGLGAAGDAKQAILDGAWDYIEKSSPRRMAQALEQVLSYREERVAARPAGQPCMDRAGIVGDSPALNSSLEDMFKIARGEANVLISGATGTGKEAFARAIHANSSRRDKAFVVVDCACLPDNLAESILFGHVRGAFTGAGTDRDGLVVEADKGTLFLDEVGELPADMQSSFLRLLQEHSFRPVGAAAERCSDFRLVAATNQDLEAMATAGEFRFDLLYRLKGAVLPLPLLRDRREDIIPIALYYIEACCRKRGMESKSASKYFLEVLAEYSWPGNVRELVNAVDYAVNSAFYEKNLFHAHLPSELRAQVMGKRIQNHDSKESISGFEHFAETLPLLCDYRKKVLERSERHYLEQLLLLTDNDMGAACAMSGLSRSRLYALLSRYNIATPGSKRF